MQLFYTTAIEGNDAWLRDQEFHHARHVLRRKTGEELHFTDGRGCVYRGRIREISDNGLGIDIQEKIIQQAPSYAVTVIIAPTKQMARFEWCLEKLTELGVDRILPVICARSERKHLQMARLEKVLISAMKQSLKCRLPQLDPPEPFVDSLRHVAGGQELKFLAHLDETSGPLEKHYLPGKNVILCIGPEGDFTDQEIGYAKTNGFVPVTLSASRLRTETAALAACQAIHVLNRCL